MRDATDNHISQMKMKVKINSNQVRLMITRGFATVEPIFGNLRGNKQLHLLYPHGKIKVDGQWKLYCIY